MIVCGGDIRRRGAGLVAVGCIAIAALSACGGSGAPQTTVPPTAGRSYERAMTALCSAGVRVTVNRNEDKSTTPSASFSVDAARVVITGTTPPSGTAVPKGSVVVLHETLPPGFEILATTGVPNCLAPVTQTTTMTPNEQAALAAVAASAVGRTIAVGYPTIAASRSCVVLRTSPTPPTRVPATCITSVDDGPGLEIVSYTEAWSGPVARRDDGVHTWQFIVQPHHAVTSGGSVGDPPRAIVG